MKAGWETEKLGTACSLLNRGISPKYIESSGIRVLNQKCIRDHRVSYEQARRHDLAAKAISESRYIQLGDVLVNSTGTGTLGRVAQVREVPEEPTTVDSHVTIVRPKQGKFYQDFFGYILILIEEKIKEAGEGCGGQTELARSVLAENFSVSYPTSIVEQQRIVAILDQAFESIAKARANAEQNLQNARDLFESHVQSVFSVRGEFVEPPHTSTSSGRTGWVDTTIGECTKFIDYRGKTPIKTEFGTPLITAKNVKMGYIQDEPREYVSPDIYDEWMTRGIPRKGDVLFTTEAPLANVAQLSTDEKVVFAQRIIIMQPDKVKLDQKFLKFLLMSAPIQSRIHEKATGATAQGIKASLLKTIKISFPNTITEQIKIAEQLESLDEETQRLEALYQRKIACLDELKKSLLQQAFAGELIADIQPSNIILLPTKKPMSSTDVHAGILALAYQKHEDKGNVVNFGHVKAEKIAHMVEAVLSIDLGRVPFKDAAGPNDYPHLKSVESRARKAGYFDFKQVNIGAYRVTKLNKFDEITDKTRTFLAKEMAAIDKLLELMLPIDTQQAEIFCTVYAAWNNLLLDGMQPTDEAIVYEARENWHPDKLKIPREKFFAAITWMRDKQIVPKGTGKKVLARNTK